ncbi:MAG TPA: acyl-ACP--UDP-N-acetylglucosamine O-acyltransferase [Alphaproteobacteria bacterium]|nr:acyl-ACP--UDP-N-acetylglucosamine O-acyltransferase [Alphaproteobacteria bacterium]
MTEPTKASATIHPTAIVHPKAVLGQGVTIGPYSIVGADVVLHDRVQLMSHVVIDGRTTIGADSIVYPFASLGQIPQDLKYKGEPATLEIGARNRIREHVTMNIGTEGGGMVTRIGDDGLFMVNAHVAHDCILGNRVIMANNATLAGHIEVGDFAFLGGMSAVHQFVRIGPSAMVGGMTGVEQDVIPFGLVTGDRARLTGLNLVGMERRGFPREDIQGVRSAYRMMFGPDGTLAERIEEVGRVFADNPYVRQIIEFARAKSSRGLCQPRAQNGN